MGNPGDENDPLRLQRKWTWTGESHGQPFMGIYMVEKDKQVLEARYMEEPMHGCVCPKGL